MLLTGKVSARRRFVVSGDLVILLVDGAGGWCLRNRACFFSTKRVLEMEDDTVSYPIDSKTVVVSRVCEHWIEFSGDEL